MERYNLDVSRDTLEKIKKIATACVDRQTWLPVKAPGDFIGANLSDLFGSGDLGWSLFTLQYDFQMMDSPHGVYVSVPKPEEIPACPYGRTVREQMDDLDSRERPALEDWLSKNGIGNGAQSSEKVCMQNALAIMRRLAENGQYLCPKLVEQLSEMRTLIHTMIGTGENCCDATVSEYVEAVRKATRLDSMDAFAYAVRALLDNKGKPGVKEAINSVYGSAMYEGAGLAGALKSAAKESLARLNNAVNGGSEDSNAVLPDPCERENVRSEEPNALFVTIEIGMFEATPENIEMVNSFVLNAGEGRDIHLRII